MPGERGSLGSAPEPVNLIHLNCQNQRPGTLSAQRCVPTICKLESATIYGGASCRRTPFSLCPDRLRELAVSARAGPSMCGPGGITSGGNVLQSVGEKGEQLAPIGHGMAKWATHWVRTGAVELDFDNTCEHDQARACECRARGSVGVIILLSIHYIRECGGGMPLHSHDGDWGRE